MAIVVIDLTRPLRPIEFLLEDMFPIGYVSLVGAKEGVGKTSLLTGLAWQMTRPAGLGRFLGRRVRHGSTLIVNTDAADGEARGIQYWLDRHENTYPDGERTLIRVIEPKEGVLSDEDWPAIFVQAEELGASLVMVDSYMTTFPRDDSNCVRGVMGPMMTLRNLAAELGTAVVVTDHLPKRAKGERDGDRGIMGSVGKQAQGRAVYLLTLREESKPHTPALLWTTTKSSFGPRPDPIAIDLKLANNERGLPMVDVIASDHVNVLSGTDKARRVIEQQIEQAAGGNVTRKELLAAAEAQADVSHRTAEEALANVLVCQGERIEVVTLAGRGAPKAYRLAEHGAISGDVAEDAITSDAIAVLYPQAASTDREQETTLEVTQASSPVGFSVEWEAN